MFGMVRNLAKYNMKCNDWTRSAQPPRHLETLGEKAVDVGARRERHWPGRRHTVQRLRVLGYSGFDTHRRCLYFRASPPLILLCAMDFQRGEVGLHTNILR